ncbi:MAG TPA: sulfotransferase [Candidatus Dormibacteraeota bacterium]|nr:sulfotransferase [Candidatus Dormibacteraeota bacterium]
MNAPTPTDALAASLDRAHTALRAGQAVSAERWLRQFLATHPANLNAAWLLGAALLELERLPEGVAMLEQVIARAPELAEARVDLARAYQRSGRAADAREQVRQVLERTPHHHRAWLAYGDALVELKQYPDAQVAYERARLTDLYRERTEAATAALLAQERRKSEEIFREILLRDPAHVAALAGLAALSLAADVPRDAERLLRHALRQCAHSPLAWRGLAQVLLALGRLEEALAAARHAAEVEPKNPQTWITIGGVSTRLMRQEQALAAYRQAAQLQPPQQRLALSIGHVHKTLGNRAESEAAYKEALQIDPGFAEAYWSLADLKNYSFGDAELATMEALALSDPREPGNEAQLHFALGKAREQRRDYGQAFAHYARGNALKRRDTPFEIEHFERRGARIRAFFDAAFFAARAGSGDASRAPIFIVGLPRSGSTLLEQILASHPQVEGTMELPNIVAIAYEFDDLVPSRDGYPETLRQASDARLGALGARYLAQTAPLRHGRERFTDKLPNNFSHVGLIHAILPNATIIDARRHPMDACFSAFKQHFAQGQAFSYDLTDLGRYYRTYLALMDHWDQVLPGKVLHVQYEQLVRDPETHIRRLLAHCGLPFEPACLAFHETRRSVRTASAEQVRQPLYSSGVGYWRNFATELEPLRHALGDSLQRFGE